MPVVTRSKANELLFIDNITNLINNNKSAKNKTNRMKYLLEAYKEINKELPIIVSKNPHKWAPFVYSVLEKTYDLEIQKHLGDFNNIDEKMVSIFVKEIEQAKEMALTLVDKYNIDKIGLNCGKYYDRIEDDLASRKMCKKNRK